MNLVAKYRAKAKLSQRALAAQVGVSQQTIQRIEAEAVTVRFETATKVARALGVPLQTLFPDTHAPTGAFPAQRDAVIDYSHCSHTLNVGFTDGVEKEYFVDEATASRVRTALFDPSARFLRFETGSHSVVLNTGEVLWTNILFDPGDVSEPATGADEVLTAYFSGSPKPSCFEIEPDEGSLEDEDEEGIQFQHLLFMLDALIEPGTSDVLHFQDSDGEEVILRTARLKIVELPLHVANPRLLAAIREGMDEDEPINETLGAA